MINCLGLLCLRRQFFSLLARRSMLRVSTFTSTPSFNFLYSVYTTPSPSYACHRKKAESVALPTRLNYQVYHSYVLPSHVKYSAIPLSASFFPPRPCSSITCKHIPTLSCTEILPSTPQAKDADLAISVSTSPGCSAKTVGGNGWAVYFNSEARCY